MKKEIIIGMIFAVIVTGTIGGIAYSQMYTKQPFEDVQETQETKNGMDNQENNAEMKQMEEAIVKCVYELKYIFAVENFNRVQEVSVNKLAQYALCHLYYESLVDVPKSEELEYRDAEKKDLEAVLRNQFHVEGLDLEQSDIYNEADDKFEMWIPNYSQQIYYQYTTTNQDDGIIFKVTYYNDEMQKERKGEAIITVKKEGKEYYIVSVK